MMELLPTNSSHEYDEVGYSLLVALCNTGSFELFLMPAFYRVLLANGASLIDDSPAGAFTDFTKP